MDLNLDSDTHVPFSVLLLTVTVKVAIHIKKKNLYADKSVQGLGRISIKLPETISF